MKLGIMQPYLFPYLGYFQLINAVDKFVIYDDVQYIKGGWINSNKVVFNKKIYKFTFPIKNASHKLHINERYFSNELESFKEKFLKTIYLAYKKAPYFKNVFPLLENITNYDENNVALFVQNSIEEICGFLDINTKLLLSSSITKNNNIEGQDRILEINKKIGSDVYINPVGGKELYSNKAFQKNGISLYFLKMKEIRYRQFSEEFIPNLSIIDVMMFNSVSKIHELLNEYDLE